jgi:hypothetical protein
MKGNVKYFIFYDIKSFLLFFTHNNSLIRCGHPCSHVLKVTNEITIDMIKVQHWKIYAAHYEDMLLGIGLELKKMQFHYQQNECMGVPISWDILQRSCRPSIDDIFPYFYDNRTTEAEYQRAKNGGIHGMMRDKGRICNIKQRPNLKRNGECIVCV